MGISIGGAKLLLQEAVRKPFRGRVLTLGKQDILLSWSQLTQISREANVVIRCDHDISLSSKPWWAEKAYITDKSFLMALGFGEVRSIDASSYEGADYILDLNCPDLPDCLVGQFDVIIDGGTIEHVFHIPNALRNIFRMLAPGGRVIHQVPSSNHIDHGFYMFSPTLFWEFYATNHFDINSFQVIRFTQDYNGDPWEIYDYTPNCLVQASFGGLDDGMYAINCVATKTEISTGDLIPQQGLFVALWQKQQIEQGNLKATNAQIESKSAVQHSVSLPIQLLKKIFPTQAKRFLRAAASRLRGKSSAKPIPKGIRLPMALKCRTRYD